jgi:DNA-binding NtrC family response regulator
MSSKTFDPSAPGLPPEVEHDATMRRDVSSVAVGFDLVVTSGTNVGTRIELHPGDMRRVLIGTSEACDLRLSDRMVSRRHAALEFNGLNLMVVDLDSTNGTFVNDTRIASAYVEGNDTLRVGNSVLKAVAKPMSPTITPTPKAFGRFVGQSPRVLNVFAGSTRLANTDVPIIIEGDTGTGKELLAECIHEAGPRSQGPFVVLDCRSVSTETFEHILTGSEASSESRSGLIEMARGGTLFVDEPAELSLDLQATLVRALDRGEAAGGRPDVRVIVATSRDLDNLIENGKFREDLYYRLAGARIELPSLAKRPGDLELIAKELWTRHGYKGSVPQEFFDRYTGYAWPGNVRELERAIERFAVLGQSGPRSPVASAAEPKTEAPSQVDGAFRRILDENLAFPEARRRVLEAFEEAYIEKVLKENGGVVARAAAASGIARRYFQTIRARRAAK